MQPCDLVAKSRNYGRVVVSCESRGRAPPFSRTPPPPLPPALSRRPASFLFTNNIRAASERAGRQFGLTELCRLPRTLWNHFDFLRYSLGLLGEKTLLFVGYLALPRSIPLQSSTHCFMSNQNSHLSHST